MAVVRGTDFDNARVGKINGLPIRFIPNHIAERKRLKPNDIVFETAGGSKDRPTGRSLFVSQSLVHKSHLPLICASFSRFLRIDPTKALPNFIFWLLQNAYRQGQLRQYNTQHTGVSRFQYTIFSESEKFLIPPYENQRRIAAILSAYDDLIENNTRRIQILEEMARRIYEEWFVQFRFPGHEKVKMVESEFGLIPDGWEITNLGSVCERIQSGGTPSRTNNDYWLNGTIDWYKTKELWDGYLFDSEERITEQAITDKKTKLFDAETILMAIYGSPTVGRLGILVKTSSCNQAALGLVPARGRMTLWMLYYTLQSLRVEFNSKAQGAAQQNISKEKVGETLFIKPIWDIQNRFQEFVTPFWKQLLNLQKSNVNLRRTSDLLLPKLISGEIDVSQFPEPVSD